MDVELGRLFHRHPHHGRPPYARFATESPAVRQHPHPSFSQHRGGGRFNIRTAKDCSSFLSLDDKCLVAAYVLVVLLCCLFFALVGVAIYATALFLSLPDNTDYSISEQVDDPSSFDPRLRLPRLGGKGFFVVGAPPHSSLFIDDSDGSVHIFHGISYVLRKWSTDTSTDLATSRSRGGASSRGAINRDSSKWRQTPATQDEEIERHMEAIAGLGLNLVRLGVQWADYEPTRGHYDPSYVRLVRHAVDVAARQGLYVLIYPHQVMLSAKLCGEGFPDWAVSPSFSGDNVRSMGKTFDDFLDRIDRLRSGLYDDDDGDDDEAWDGIYEVDDQGQKHTRPEQQEDIGMELPESCPAWLAPSYYFTPQVASAYQNFYLGQQGAMHRFGAWWADVARRFRDDPAVIGYQLLSQAFAGDYYHSPALLHPGENDARNLAAVYAFLSAQIRRVDADHLIFFSDTYAVPLSRSMSPTSSLSLSASTPSVGAAYSSTASRDSLVTHAGVGFARLPSATFDSGGRGQPERWAEGDGNSGDCEHNDDCARGDDDDDDAGRKQAGKEVLAFSYECWYFDQTDPFPVPAYRETCNLFKGEDLLGYRKRDARRLGSGLFVHGLGGCGLSHEERSCEYLLEQASAGSLSWSYGLDHDHDEVRRVLDAAGGGETQLRRLLSRPFARRLAGVPRSATFDPNTRHFTLAFYPYAQRGGKEAGGVTEIYLDEELHYPKGYTVSVFPLLLNHAAVPEKNLLRLSLRAEFAQGRFAPGEVVVTIAPKQ